MKDDYSGLDITESLRRRGPWYLLLHIHTHIWKNTGFAFRERYQAAQIPLMLWEECWTDVFVQRGQV